MQSDNINNNKKHFQYGNKDFKKADAIWFMFVTKPFLKKRILK